MALGRFHFNVALDSVTDPDDTTVLAAPGIGQQIYVQWADLVVSTLQASSSVALEDGVGGSVLSRGASTAAGTVHLIEYNGGEGVPLTENTALNGTVEGATGVVARVIGEAVVRGGV